MSCEFIYCGKNVFDSLLFLLNQNVVFCNEYFSVSKNNEFRDFLGDQNGCTRIGHNGSDAGVRNFMLSDLDRKIGVIVFFNTSLAEKDENVFFDIYEELYKYAKGMEFKSNK